MTQQYRTLKILPASVLSAIMGVVISSSVFASAFQLFEQSDADLGNAHAGGAALADDATTAYYNPAGLTELQRAQVILGGTLIYVRPSFFGTAQTTQNIYTLPPVVTVIGSNGVIGPQTGSASSIGRNFVPEFYIAAPIDPKIAVGFAVTVPYGLDLNWYNSSLVRYAATDTNMKVIDLSPVIAYQVDKRLSVGMGLDVERLNATFDQVAALGSDNTNDALSNNKGDAWGVGWHAGILVKPWNGTRLGLNYASSVRFNVHGVSNFVLIGSNPAISTAWGVPPQGFFTSGLATDARLPATTTASIYQQLNERWAVMASAIYTQWSQFNKTLTLQNVNIGGFLIPVSLPQNFRDTWAYSFGANYKFNDKLLLRAGVQWDQTPTNNTDRGIRLPDANRTLLAVGAHYQFLKSVGVDVGYGHIFSGAASIHNTVSETVPVFFAGTQIANEIEATRLDGDAKAQADLLGGQVVWDIG